MGWPKVSEDIIKIKDEKAFLSSSAIWNNKQKEQDRRDAYRIAPDGTVSSASAYYQRAR